MAVSINVYRSRIGQYESRKYRSRRLTKSRENMTTVTSKSRIVIIAMVIAMMIY